MCNASCLQKFVINPLIDIGVPVAIGIGILGFGFTSPAIAVIATTAAVTHFASRHFQETSKCAHLIAAPLTFSAALILLGSFGALAVIDPIGAIVIGGALFITRLIADLLSSKQRENLAKTFLPRPSSLDRTSVV